MTPEAYARQIAYISNPSTIRARVLEEYGRAPSIERIRKIQNERLCANDDIEPYEEDDFRVVGLVKIEPKQQNQAINAMSGNLKFIPTEIIIDVCQRLDVSVDEVVSAKGRTGMLIHARRLISAILRYRGKSYPFIGEKLGGRDHSTIINLCKKVSMTFDKVEGSKSIFDEYAKEWDRIVASRVENAPKRKGNVARRIPCICVETGQRFASIYEAAVHMIGQGWDKAKSANISRACHFNSVAYGHHWRHA